MWPLRLSSRLLRRHCARTRTRCVPSIPAACCLALCGAAPWGATRHGMTCMAACMHTYMAAHAHTRMLAQTHLCLLYTPYACLHIHIHTQVDAFHIFRALCKISGKSAPADPADLDSVDMRRKMLSLELLYSMLKNSGMHMQHMCLHTWLSTPSCTPAHRPVRTPAHTFTRVSMEMATAHVYCTCVCTYYTMSIAVYATCLYRPNFPQVEDVRHCG